MRAILAALLAVTLGAPARGHDAWADATPIPAWIKSSCCGPADAHLLNDSQIHMLSDGVHIDGIRTVVPYDKVLPSMDGQIWAFYPNNGVSDPPVYCFFFSGSI